MDGALNQSWNAGWSAKEPPPIEYLVVPNDSRPWQASWRNGLMQQDLGFAQASNGQFATWRIRADSTTGSGEDWPDRDLDFCWAYVLSGSLEIKGPYGTHLILRPHDAIFVPRGWRPAAYWYSGDFECLEVTAHAAGKTGQGAAHATTALAPIVSTFSPNSFKPVGPRPIFEYRDFETGPLTGSRVGIQVIRPFGPPKPGGTGRHAHTWAQWNITLSGWYDITVDGHAPSRLSVGDSTFTPASAPHDVTAYSPDLAILNLDIPAEGETTEL